MVKIRRTTRLTGPAREIVCAKCGSPSFERGSEADPARSENYNLITYECASCGHFETRSVLREKENGRGRAE